MRADAATKAFMVHGEGAVSCGAWAADRREGHWYPESAWILGYLTAYNRYVWKKTDIAEGTDSDGIAAWMDGYCVAHPLDTIADGAQQLIVALIARSLGGRLQNEYGP
jgi:hypothetical protein